MWHGMASRLELIGPCAQSFLRGSRATAAARGSGRGLAHWPLGCIGGREALALRRTSHSVRCLSCARGGPPYEELLQTRGELPAEAVQVAVAIDPLDDLLSAARPLLLRLLPWECGGPLAPQAVSRARRRLACPVHSKGGRGRIGATESRGLVATERGNTKTGGTWHCVAQTFGAHTVRVSGIRTRRHGMTRRHDDREMACREIMLMERMTHAHALTQTWPPATQTVTTKEPQARRDQHAADSSIPRATRTRSPPPDPLKFAQVGSPAVLTGRRVGGLAWWLPSRLPHPMQMSRVVKALSWHHPLYRTATETAAQGVCGGCLFIIVPDEAGTPPSSWVGR